MAPPQRLSRRPHAVRRPGREVPSKVTAASEEADKIISAGAAFRQRIRVDQIAAVSERKAVLPFTIGPVEPVGTRLLNMMIYGPYGFGKTTFAGSAADVPEMQDVLFINADSGTMSLTSRRTMDFININKYDQLARIFEYLTLHCLWRDTGNTEKLLEYEKELKSDPVAIKDQTITAEHPADPERTWFVEQRLRSGKPLDEPYLYRTAILDSISELHKYLIYKFTGVDIGTTKLDDEIEKMEEWQPAQELFRLLVRSFRDLPMNTIFVSAESIEPEKRNKVRNPRAGQALPKLAGQMAGDIAGFIDIVGYLDLVREKEGGETRRLYLGAGYEGWISKHRFENLPDLDYVDDPSLTSLIELSRKDALTNADPNTTASRPLRSADATPSRASTITTQRRRHTNTPPGSGARAGAGRRGDTVRRVHGAS